MITLLDTPTHKIEIGGRLPNASEKATYWRDGELASSDWIIPTTDHPQHAAYLTYRQALRDWPASASFPATRPTL
tara:strand:+ start:198 stop:422 length:225 start_codon:yes stop_codon:yes gene_type:complete